MATEFNGKIELDIRDSEPDWGPYAAPTVASLLSGFVKQPRRTARSLKDVRSAV